MDKKELRKIFRQKRNRISEKSEKDFKIAERVLDSVRVKNSDNIFIYVYVLEVLSIYLRGSS